MTTIIAIITYALCGVVAFRWTLRRIAKHDAVHHPSIRTLDGDDVAIALLTGLLWPAWLPVAAVSLPIYEKGKAPWWLPRDLRDVWQTSANERNGKSA